MSRNEREAPFRSGKPLSTERTPGARLRGPGPCLVTAAVCVERVHARTRATRSPGSRFVDEPRAVTAAHPIGERGPDGRAHRVEITSPQW